MIAIKDFEMPKSCYDCDLNNYHYDCDLNNYHFCNITGNLVESNRDDGTRADDCPLIEIKENKNEIQC